MWPTWTNCGQEEVLCAKPIGRITIYDKQEVTISLGLVWYYRKTNPLHNYPDGALDIIQTECLSMHQIHNNSFKITFTSLPYWPGSVSIARHGVHCWEWKRSCPSPFLYIPSAVFFLPLRVIHVFKSSHSGEGGPVLARGERGDALRCGEGAGHIVHRASRLRYQAYVGHLCWRV